MVNGPERGSVVRSSGFSRLSYHNFRLKAGLRTRDLLPGHPLWGYNRR